MISLSVRRVVLIVPTIPTTSALVNTLPRVITSKTISACSQCSQRRASSSKPPSPVDGSKDGVRRQTVASTPTESSSVEAKAPTKKKIKSTSVKNMLRGKNQTTFNIPSVPSTQHIMPSLLGPAAFFSLYRPISITSGFPQPVTKEAFASIFTPRTRNSKSQEVIMTLSNTLNNINSATDDLGSSSLDDQQNQLSGFDESQVERSRDIFSNTEPQSSEMNQILGLPQYYMSGRYAPFNPPQLPTPLNTTNTSSRTPSDSQATQHRIYRAVLTIEEFIDPNGYVIYTTHHSPLVAQEPHASPINSSERIKTRQTRSKLERSYGTGMLAISVKRQRRLKMKKHKYKKLMRRTRNLRRRLERN